MRPLITSVRVEPRGGHAHVGLWVRGQKAGDVVVDLSDSRAFAERLIPDGVNEERADGSLVARRDRLWPLPG